MCVMSMVHDHFDKTIPWDKVFPNAPYQPTQTHPAITITGQPMLSPAELADLRKLIQEFREAIAAAATIDRLTKQPDCVDPEKAKLEDRVATLEKRLDAMQRALSP